MAEANFLSFASFLSNEATHSAMFHLFRSCFIAVSVGRNRGVVKQKNARQQK